MNWERLKTFYKVVQCGSLKKTAELYNITPSALSKAIKLLEEELKTTLFVRHDKGLKLTNTGKEFYKYIATIQKNINHALEAIQANQHKLEGQIKIIAPPGFSTMYLSNYIGGFLVDYPDISIVIENSEGKDLSKLLDSDILIHTGIDRLENYEQIFLKEFQLKLYASVSYIEKYGIPKSSVDLDTHRFIAYSQSKVHLHADLNWHLKIDNIKNKRRRIVAEVDENFGRCRIAARGIGIVSVPRNHPDIKQFNLIEILPDLEGPICSYYLIIEKSALQLSRINVLKGALLNFFKP